MKEAMTNKIKQSVLSDAADCVKSGDLEWDEMSAAAQSILYEAFYQEMPYGIANGDDGCPDEWILDQEPQYILDRLESHLDKMIERGDVVWDKWH